MNPLTYSSIRFSLLLMIMIFMAKLHAHEAKPVDEETMMDSNDSEYENDVEKINRDYDLKKLRHFLLTANAAKLAARRKQHDLIKKELVKKRFVYYLFCFSSPNIIYTLSFLFSSN